MTNLPHQSAGSTLSSRQVFTVSALNADVRQLLEINYESVAVEGEISNLARPASGHWYFTLKDEKAQVKCAMFRGRNSGVRFAPENGKLVRLTARVSLYEGRGDYQLLVDRMEPAGDGALQQAFEALKRKLHAEGLFDAERKKPLPEHIRHLGVITSPTGAAIRDILSVLKRRFPAMRVTILPVPVQGAEAAPAMIRALAVANARRGPLQDLDALVIGRGGGSLEDLWAFNEESLAWAIAGSTLPVISAVGHEVDFTISDFVADLRAATPSAAAELVSPSQDEYHALFRAYGRQLQSLVLNGIRDRQQKLQALGKSITDPRRRLREHAQRLDELELRLKRGLLNSCYRASNSLRHLQTLLQHNSPALRVGQTKKDLAWLHSRLHKGMHSLLGDRRKQLGSLGHTLHAVSPLATLGRGYAIALDGQGTIVRSVSQISRGETITTRIHDGSIVSTVNAVLDTQKK